MTVKNSLVRMEGNAEIWMETTPASAPHRMLESSASYVCAPPLDTHISNCLTACCYSLCLNIF